ncbi:hypothetical protein EIP91_003749 [Steccherinum ochraceum]|uniref:Uncharacterized protein n=1 Tax=Steccherinum ochraceum TaxID=92696 RepID=A0A4R0RCI5_9APHY|nr:hypothetical protein EIP91_003749 [Steccherinum ochraceum]
MPKVGLKTHMHSRLGDWFHAYNSRSVIPGEASHGIQALDSRRSIGDSGPEWIHTSLSWAFYHTSADHAPNVEICVHPLKNLLGVYRASQSATSDCLVVKR